MIEIICLGKIKEKYFLDAIDEYKKRLSKYNSIKIIEILDEPDIKDENKSLNLEEAKIMPYAKQKGYNIGLFIDGKSYSSLEFAKVLKDIFTYKNSKIKFFIGSSRGLTSNIKKNMDLCLSFSKFTFPHKLMRVILLEQIYRAYKIINNETYHK